MLHSPACDSQADPTQHGSLLDKPEVEVAILEINGLAYELLKRSRRAEPEFD